MFPKQNTLFLFLLISAIVFIAFLPSLFCDFTNFDDTWMLTTNHLVRKLTFAHVTHNIFGDIYKGVYQPLVFLSYAIEYYFFGLKPFIYHFDNTILHILVTLLVFVFINQLSGNKTAALIACLFWTLSPLRVESVTWVSERKDLLYAFFYLLSLIKYVHYLKSGNKKIHLLFSLLFFFFSCLSKLTAVSLSFIIVLLDYYFNRKPDLKLIAEKVVYFTISLTVGIFSLWVLKMDDEMVTSFQYSITERAQLVSHSLINYFVKSLIPYNLSVFHPYQYPPGFLPKFYFIFLILSIFAIATFTWLFLKLRNKKIIFGILFFLSALVFALQIFPVGDAAFADRNIYISHIGIAFLIGELYLLLVKRFAEKIVIPAACLILLIYGFLTFQQIKIWSNSGTLFTNVIEKYPESYLGYLNRGIAKDQTGDYQGAIEDFNKSLERSPKYYKALLNRALVREKLNDFDGALRDYNEILLIAPNYQNAYIARGALYHRSNRFNEAILDFSRAIEIKPVNPFLSSVAFLNRAQSRLSINNIDSAIADLTFAMSIIPDNSEACYLKGLCFFSKKEFLKARENFLMTLSLNPKNSEAYYSLGLCEISLNNSGEGCEFLKHSAMLGSIDGKKMYLFHCSDPETKKKMFHPNGNYKFSFTSGINDQNDTLFFLCNYDSAGKIFQRGAVDFLTKKYNGEIIWYYPEGSIQKIGFLRDSIPFGSWKEFFPDGNIRAEYSFSRGVLSGIYKFYYPGKKIQMEKYYYNGKLKNVFFCRDINGNPIKFGSFAGGNGTLKEFDENGKIIHESIYEDGETISEDFK